VESGGGEIVWDAHVIALRASAILSILVSVLYLQGLLLYVHSGLPIDNSIWMMIVTVSVPLISGLLAVFGRMTILLPIAWGWQLGMHLPRLLIVRPQIPPEMIQMMKKGGGSFYVIGPNYPGMAAVAIAFVGLGLYLFAYYKQGVR
jgi:hypothetical protein